MKNLIVTVNGVAYNVTVEEGTGAPVAAAAPVAAPEKSCGTEALRHKKQNKAWTAEEKYELVAKVLAGASCTEAAIAAGIDSGLLYRWVKCYRMKGYEGLAAHQLEVAQAVTDTKIEELTREVRMHNNFAQRVPVMEEKIAVANHRIDDLERHEEKERKI